MGKKKRKNDGYGVLGPETEIDKFMSEHTLMEVIDIWSEHRGLSHEYTLMNALSVYGIERLWNIHHEKSEQVKVKLFQDAT